VSCDAVSCGTASCGTVIGAGDAVAAPASSGVGAGDTHPAKTASATDQAGFPRCATDIIGSSNECDSGSEF
jgi:hypothetical protein